MPKKQTNKQLGKNYFGCDWPNGLLADDGPNGLLADEVEEEEGEDPDCAICTILLILFSTSFRFSFTLDSCLPSTTTLVLDNSFFSSRSFINSSRLDFTNSGP